MENKNEDLINNIYTSYGPVIGKICENTNNTNNFLNENVIDSITKSVEKIEKVIDDSINNLNFKDQNFNDQNDINYYDYLFFNYKLNILNYDISIWTLLLILIAIGCILYFIYNYTLKSSSNNIYYKKNTENNSIDNNNFTVLDSDDKTNSYDSSNDKSSDNLSYNNISNKSKSSKSSNSSSQ